MRFVAAIGLVIAFGLISPSPASSAERLALSDAHIHYSHDAWETLAPAEAVAILRRAGLKRAFVSSSSDEGTLRLHALAPDLVVLLDMEPERGFERTGKGRDYLERAGIEFHRAVRRGFLEQAAADPDRWLVLDATRPEMQITHAIVTRVTSMLGQRQ